ncbi:MAG TPA: ECF transporter S component [Candidatus Eremiobacteraeota bacterium]|nr:MAG: Riboflavin transporter RibU [bacterium ADurb.Bin363]HPZ07175.1 ECF transporter S component [Candidatus Eremiobacteraeota bacterium]
MDSGVDAFEKTKSSAIVSPTLSKSLLRLRKLIIISLFSSLSFLIMSYLEFSLLPSFPMLKYDASDVPALILGFSMGTSAGIYVMILKNFMYLLLSGKGFTYLGIGPFMNCLAGSAMVFVATKVYFLKPGKKTAILGLTIGTLFMTLIMVPINYLLLSILPVLFPYLSDYFSPDKALIFIFSGVLPFNLLKGFLTSVFSFFLYKKISPFIKFTV